MSRPIGSSPDGGSTMACNINQANFLVMMAALNELSGLKEHVVKEVKGWINVSIAPEVGLYLEECFFTSYNQKWKDTHDEISMEAYVEQAEDFKMKQVYSHIASMEQKEGSVAVWLHSLNLRNYPDLRFVEDNETCTIGENVQVESIGGKGFIVVNEERGLISSCCMPLASINNCATPAQASMVAPFTGLKSTSAFPVKVNDITSISSNGGKVSCMQAKRSVLETELRGAKRSVYEVFEDMKEDASFHVKKLLTVYLVHRGRGFDIIVMSTRCLDSCDEAEEIKKFVKETLKLGGLLSVGDVLGPLSKFDLFGHGKKLKVVMGLFDKLLEGIMREHEEKRCHDKRGGDPMDVLLEILRDENSEVKLTRNDIKSFILVSDLLCFHFTK
ncbi:hypothetical protein IFM89_001001 [Coptis chinensis]|uniref:Ribulose-1,5-bisphosphate carboxylase small subunit N-terminal domain-containing protein n=1 Tax=Coptis chinensis TaxID=261450 RepID=A0A835IIF1_9MAGN|nr:hypothetical protein IFM89_001001 [Coptis chinensis]